MVDRIGLVVRISGVMAASTIRFSGSSGVIPAAIG